MRKVRPRHTEFPFPHAGLPLSGGDRDLFEKLREKLVPKLIMREYQPLVERLSEITRARYAKFGNTVFHLEPNMKEGPGGLRDYNLVHWLALISTMDQLRRWPEEQALLPPQMRGAFEQAYEFLLSVRACLHLRHNRDDNTLTWEAQEEAAKRGIWARTRRIRHAGGMDAHITSGTRALDHVWPLSFLDEIPCGEVLPAAAISKLARAGFQLDVFP